MHDKRNIQLGHGPIRRLKLIKTEELALFKRKYVHFLYI